MFSYLFQNLSYFQVQLLFEMHFRFCKRSVFQTYTRVPHDLGYKSYVGLQGMSQLFLSDHSHNRN